MYQQQQPQYQQQQYQQQPQYQQQGYQQEVVIIQPMQQPYQQGPVVIEVMQGGQQHMCVYRDENRCGLRALLCFCFCTPCWVGGICCNGSGCYCWDVNQVCMECGKMVILDM